jgi:spore coat protein U-like protein
MVTVAVRSFLIAALCGAVIAVTPQIASAAPNCNFTGATIAFGSFDVYGAALSVAGTVSGICTSGASTNTKPIITLGKGANSATYAARKMSCVSGACLTGFSSDLLQYNLYTTAAHSTVWGDPAVDATTAHVQLATSCCTNNKAFSTSVYGLMPAAIASGVNDVAVGGYQDTVVVTMTF